MLRYILDSDLQSFGVSLNVLCSGDYFIRINFIRTCPVKGECSRRFARIYIVYADAYFIYFYFYSRVIRERKQSALVNFTRVICNREVLTFLLEARFFWYILLLAK
jgi:hypothetical protein